MLHHRINVAIFLFLFGITSATISCATPGALYYVQEDNTKLYDAPSSTAPVVMLLNRGDRVIEWRRQGSWIRVSRMGTVGRDAWVKISHLVSEPRGNRDIEIEANSNGQFVLEVEVNGTVLKFIVDTGATTTLLSPRDADKLGFDKSTLEFSQRISTANGIARAAIVKLDEVSIGQFKTNNVIALISRNPIRLSLLGMNFLRQLDSYEVRGDQLILRW